ncbi:DUF2322 family protein [Craterilacuibacter sp.]|uniref:DUF2322 family protein n=1 Tax=Craterilacuibacter sp. TaxID=2870909 RepID=UPI003F301A2E
MNHTLFADNLASLPECKHLTGLELLDEDGHCVASLLNQPGTTGSVRVYAALGARFGMLTPEAAQAGILLYAEHSRDAELHPGKHPNIDRLFAIASGELGTLHIISQQ